MAKSTYYFELSKVNLVDERNIKPKEEIQNIFTEHKGRYGVRRVYQELLNRGFVVNHKRVQRLMKVMELAGKRPKEKYHSYKGQVGKIADNIINRDFSTTAPLQKWTTGFPTWHTSTIFTSGQALTSSKSTTTSIKLSTGFHTAILIQKIKWKQSAHVLQNLSIMPMGVKRYKT